MRSAGEGVTRGHGRAEKGNGGKDILGGERNHQKAVRGIRDGGNRHGCHKIVERVIEERKGGLQQRGSSASEGGAVKALEVAGGASVRGLT